MTVTKTLSRVFVSHRTSSCCTLKDRVPATLSPAAHMARSVLGCADNSNGRSRHVGGSLPQQGMIQLKPCTVKSPCQPTASNAATTVANTTRMTQAERTGCAARENLPNLSTMATVACPGHVKHDCKKNKASKPETAGDQVCAETPVNLPTMLAKVVETADDKQQSRWGLQPQTRARKLRRRARR